MKKSIILSCIALLSAMPVWADVTVQGVIRDAHSKEPLAGVLVGAFSNSKVTAMTDEEGKYSITLPDYETSIRVSRDGYNTQQVSVANHSGEVDILLYVNAFSEIVGLGKSAQIALSAPVNHLSADYSIDEQITTSLGGQVRSMSRGGVPGLGAFMLLNGINSINANAQPLIVIDGVIQDMEYNRSSLFEGFYNNLLANYSVYDIESVSVLRNGTAIYGTKGANGVILINTRRSHSYTTKIDVNISGGFEATPRLPEMMNASEYRTYVSEMIGSTGTPLIDFKFLREDPSYYYYKVYHNNTDWTKEVYHEAFMQQYNINVQGGDDAADYNLSLGYAKADATLRMNDFSRFNLRLNSDVKLTHNAKIRIDAAYSDVNRDIRDDGVPTSFENRPINSPGFLALIKSPFLSPYGYDNQGNLSHFLAEEDDYLDQISGYAKDLSLSNPVSLLNYGERRNKNSFGNRMISLSIAPTINLKHRITLSDVFSFTMFNTEEGYFEPSSGTASFYVKDVRYLRNVKKSSSSHQYNTTNDLSIQWKYKNAAHDLSLHGGYRMNFLRYQQNALWGYNADNDKSPNLSKDLAERQTDGVNDYATTLTYYAQGDYSFASKYFLNVALSLETSSRFGKEAEKSVKLCGQSWALLPSVSASWVVTNEEWMPSLPWLNYLRINAAYDITGNDDIALNTSRTYFSAVNLLKKAGGSVVGGIGNTKIKWETTKRASYGLESNLLENRLSVAVNAYKSWTSDLLSLQPLAFVTGQTKNWANGGSLENTGVDVTLLGKVINTKDWQWQLGLSLGHYKNEVTELQNGTVLNEYCNATIASMVGQPVGVFYGYKTNGIYRTYKEADEDGQYMVDNRGVKSYFSAGDVRFQNLEGSDKEINEKDRTIIGDPNPDIYGNISSHLQWKNLALDLVFNYSVGNDIYNYQRSILEAGSCFYNQTKALRARWSSEGQQTDIPRIAYGDPMGNSRFSDRWIEDGSYLRLKDVKVSYSWDFPSSRYIQGVTVWGGAKNLFTLTKYLGSDPEFSASNNVLYQGIDCGWLPNNRNFTVGVKINL